MAPAAELARPPRIPKLTYRNRLPTDDLSLISRTSSASTDIPNNDTSADQRLSTPTCTPVSTLDYDCRSTTSSKSASLASSDESISRESKASSAKKRKNGVLNFLTLKEPSQIALDQFADAQRKQTAAKSGQSTPVGRHGISPQKLPPTVPKVNSKWDGVPESLKSSRNSITSSKRASTISSTSSQSSPSSHTIRNPTINSSTISVATHDSRGPPNSLASPMHSAIDVSEYTPTKLPPRADSPSSASLPEITYFFPADPSSLGASPVSSAEQPWSSPPRLDQDSSQAFVTDFDEKLSISGPDTVTSDEVNAIFRRLKGAAGEPQGVYFGAEDEDPDVPDTHDFLFDVNPIMNTPPPRTSSHQAPAQPAPPVLVPHYVPTRRPTANFSRPRPNQTVSNPPRPSPYSYNRKFSAPVLPTLYEASIASIDDTDAASDTTEIGRTDTRGSTDSTESLSAPSIAPSTAPSVATSFTPSVMSASWYRSSRERLGLGGRIRKSDVLPWEQTEQVRRGKPKKSRLSVFSRG
ncbi:uncharacterized protein N0V89_011434 [Didymosphaeria variabile]|uniref:Uncharacterized protein n=1 Tax=Didymosphaeria variabile TaxID=1932322 RepID=A0A9W9C5Q8_9PLEO|nr:uncharacterized protein N0V89_011434 [Didymosphaeria variabile]KAJ4345304.1 hypothetical protein N0V89_011434 [Didymosphaeria variabile]